MGFGQKSLHRLGVVYGCSEWSSIIGPSCTATATHIEAIDLERQNSVCVTGETRFAVGFGYRYSIIISRLFIGEWVTAFVRRRSCVQSQRAAI